MENQQLPWTQDGLKLLRVIEKIIEQHGGTETMHEIVFSEVYEKHRIRVIKAEDAEIRKMLYHRIPIASAADILKISEHDYTKKLSDYKKRNHIK